MRQPDDLTLVGQALARVGLGDAVGASELISAAGRQGKASALLMAMSGYFALLAGRADEARSRLQAAVTLAPPAPRLALPLLAQIDLVQNRKEAALAEASRALTLAPNSPMALFSMALVKMASFDLPGATRYLQEAIAADPRFVRSLCVPGQDLAGLRVPLPGPADHRSGSAPGPPQPPGPQPGGVCPPGLPGLQPGLSVLESRPRDRPQVRGTSPRAGYLLVSLPEFHQGLEEMLTATLLDPRVASYQTELGKALYQTRSFDRSLEVYDYAKTLDPKDPTPYYYRGIALTDLNRPGEAVQEINKSIRAE